jgi:hypothetical protein
MPDQISEQLDSLAELDKTDLCDLWKKLFDAAPQPQLRRDLMIPILGYRIQERAYGSLSSRTVQRLRELARAIEADPNAAIIPLPRIKAGTRLVRQWRDHVHVVNVEENGFEYKGSHYESLSQIARLITGARWSGPLFFGLKAKVAAKSRVPR